MEEKATRWRLSVEDPNDPGADTWLFDEEPTSINQWEMLRVTGQRDGQPLIVIINQNLARYVSLEKEEVPS